MLHTVSNILWCSVASLTLLFCLYRHVLWWMQRMQNWPKEAQCGVMRRRNRNKRTLEIFWHGCQSSGGATKKWLPRQIPRCGTRCRVSRTTKRRREASWSTRETWGQVCNDWYRCWSWYSALHCRQPHEETLLAWSKWKIWKRSLPDCVSFKLSEKKVRCAVLYAHSSDACLSFAPERYQVWELGTRSKRRSSGDSWRIPPEISFVCRTAKVAAICSSRHVSKFAHRLYWPSLWEWDESCSFLLILQLCEDLTFARLNFQKTAVEYLISLFGQMTRTVFGICH